MPPESSKRTILVADDDPSIVRLLYEILTRKGFKVVHSTAPIGIGALVKRNNPDLLILDVMMPGLDGESVAKLINEGGSSRPVIFYSAMPESELLDLIGRVPKSTYIPKGSPITEIAETVDRVCRMYGIA